MRKNLFTFLLMFFSILSCKSENSTENTNQENHIHSINSGDNFILPNGLNLEIKSINGIYIKEDADKIRNKEDSIKFYYLKSVKNIKSNSKKVLFGFILKNSSAYNDNLFNTISKNFCNEKMLELTPTSRPFFFKQKSITDSTYYIEFYSYIKAYGLAPSASLLAGLDETASRNIEDFQNRKIYDCEKKEIVNSEDALFNTLESLVNSYNEKYGNYNVCISKNQIEKAYSWYVDGTLIKIELYNEPLDKNDVENEFYKFPFFIENYSNQIDGHSHTLKISYEDLIFKQKENEILEKNQKIKEKKEIDEIEKRAKFIKDKL